MRKTLLLSSMIIALSISSSLVKADAGVESEIGIKSKTSLSSTIANIWEDVKALGKNVLRHLVPDSEEVDNPDADIDLGGHPKAERPESTTALLSNAQVSSKPVQQSDVVSDVEKALLGELLPDAQNNQTEATPSAPLTVVKKLKDEEEKEDLQSERGLYVGVEKAGSEASRVSEIPYGKEPSIVIDMGEDNVTPDDSDAENELLARMSSTHSNNKNVGRLGLDLPASIVGG